MDHATALAAYVLLSVAHAAIDDQHSPLAGLIGLCVLTMLLIVS